MYLEPLVSLVSRGLTPADALLTAIGTGTDAKARLVAETDLFKILESP